MQYYYFVSYQFVSNTGKWGFGRAEWPWPEPIERIDQVVELEKRLTLTNPGTTNIILHYSLMRIESEAPAPTTSNESDWPSRWARNGWLGGASQTGVNV